MFKYLFFIFLSLSLSWVYAQNRDGDGDDLGMEDYIKSKQDLAAKAEELTVKAPDMSQLQNQLAGMTQNIDLAKLKNLDFDTDLTGQMDEFKSKYLKEFQDKNPFAKLPKKQIEDQIKVRLAGSKMGDFLESYPKLLDFLTNVIRDERALPKLLGILNQRHKMQIYGYVSMLLFVTTLLMNMFMRKKKNESIFLRWGRTFWMQTVLSLALFGFFYVLFRRELEPLMMVAIETFFGKQV